MKKGDCLLLENSETNYILILHHKLDDEQNYEYLYFLSKHAEKHITKMIENVEEWEE